MKKYLILFLWLVGLTVGATTVYAVVTPEDCAKECLRQANIDMEIIADYVVFCESGAEATYDAAIQAARDTYNAAIAAGATPQDAWIVYDALVEAAHDANRAAIAACADTAMNMQRQVYREYINCLFGCAGANPGNTP